MRRAGSTSSCTSTAPGRTVARGPSAIFVTFAFVAFGFVAFAFVAFAFVPFAFVSFVPFVGFVFVFGGAVMGVAHGVLGG